MITRKSWLTTVMVLGLGTTALVSGVNGFVPRAQDLSDPLGRPSSLARQVIHSASEFDRITAVLVPEHADLSQRIQMLNTVSTDLDALVAKAGKLGPAAISVNADTKIVRGVATPLPQLIKEVTGRVNQATPDVATLASAIGSVTTQLVDVGGQLGSIQTNLAALGPLATSIDTTLGQIQAESEKIKLAGPVLSLLSHLLNGNAKSNASLLSLLSGLLGGL